MLQKIRQEIHHHASPKKAVVSQRFFKTGPGQYGFGDVFIGLTVRKYEQLPKFADAPLEDIVKLFEHHSWERLLALVLLVHQYKKLILKTNSNL